MTRRRTIVTASIDEVGAEQVSGLLRLVITACGPTWLVIDAFGPPCPPEIERHRDALYSRARRRSGGAGVVMTVDDVDIASFLAYAPYSASVEVGRNPATPWVEIVDATDVMVDADFLRTSGLELGIARPVWVVREALW